MDATVLASVNQRKTATGKKKLKGNKKPIKVKYISNPMKVETCASRFRALVQELTGQDAADFPADPSKFTDTVPDTEKRVDENVPVVEEENLEPLDDGVDRVPDYFESLDGDVFMSEVMENFSNGYYYNVDRVLN